MRAWRCCRELHNIHRDTEIRRRCREAKLLLDMDRDDRGVEDEIADCMEKRLTVGVFRGRTQHAHTTHTQMHGATMWLRKVVLHLLFCSSSSSFHPLSDMNICKNACVLASTLASVYTIGETSQRIRVHA